MDDRPLPITIIAWLLVFAAAMVLGALWSGSEAGHAFAEAATSTYDSAWLPWAAVAVTAGSAFGLLRGWPFARILLVIWMVWGVFEGFLLVDPAQYSLVAIAAYVVILG